MNSVLLPVIILLPLGTGLLLSVLKLNKYRWICAISATAVLFSSAITVLVLMIGRNGPLVFAPIGKIPWLSLKLDSLGSFFAGLFAALWPIVTVFAIGFMKEEGRPKHFFSLSSLAYGASMGICMSGSPLVMYFFCQVLAAATVLMIRCSRKKCSFRNTWRYVIPFVIGAVLSGASIVYLLMNGSADRFAPGGLLLFSTLHSAGCARLFYLLGFLGFGVQTAVLPLYFWLPEASKVPAPGAVLINAVSVVNAGVFCILRLTYEAYGTDLLTGTWVQLTLQGLSIVTFLFGAVMAVKETHWKRRLSYSTMANLSYILFGISLFSRAGVTGALLHTAFHAQMKTLTLFCTGSVFRMSGKEYTGELGGFGKRMPFTFACYTASALSLIGVPPFCGFVSKWYLLTAAAERGEAAAYFGAGALLIAAFLNAVYLLTTVRKAWFPDRESERCGIAGLREPSWLLLAPMLLLLISILLTGIFAGPIAAAAGSIAAVI